MNQSWFASKLLVLRANVCMCLRHVLPAYRLEVTGVRGKSGTEQVCPIRTTVWDWV